MKIKEGIIPEKKFVELFATDKQKQKYKTSGNKFTGVNKSTVLKQAAKLCEITDIGNREYQITKVYKYPVPKNFNNMNTGIHQYLTPLILINLIAAGIYQVKNLTFTCNRWYRMVDLINDNYANMKQNIEYSSKKFEVSTNVLHDFYNTTDDTLVYYFKKSLEYLKAANLFNFQEINWVYVRTVDVNFEQDGHQCISIKPEHRRATSEEMVYIRKCEQVACKYVGISIDDESAKYYGKKSKMYLEKLRELLLEQNILFCYKAYEIYSTDNDIQRCYELLNSFEVCDKTDLIELVSTLFQRTLMVNAEKRVLNNPTKRNLLTSDDINKFLGDYKKIINLTLACGIEKVDVPNRLDEKQEHDINKIIEDNVSVLLNGRGLKIGVTEAVI